MVDMKTFAYQNIRKHACSNEVCTLIARLHEDKGKFEALRAIHPDVFDSLSKRAFFENVDASTRIEGIYLDPDRIKAILETGAEPASEEERQVLGYSEALRAIEENPAMPFSTSTIVGFHDKMYGAPAGGKKRRSSYRKKDFADVVTPDGVQHVKVSPIAAFETPLYLGAACDSLAGCLDMPACNELLLIPNFTVDFLCIRPFDLGCGRLTRLISHLLLLRCGLDVTRYMSLDRIIEASGMEYYDALNACVLGWDENKNDYGPFVIYWLTKLHECYEKLFASVNERNAAQGMSKPKRVEAYFEAHEEVMTKSQIKEALPDISISTIENALRDLVNRGVIQKVGSGKLTAYRRIRHGG